MLKAIKKWIFLFLPDLKPFVQQGFQTHIENGDLILRKKYSGLTVSLHQSVEPFNPKFGALIDFDIEDACVIFEFPEEGDIDGKLIDELRDCFDYSYLRKNYFFCMLKRMEFDDQRLIPVVTNVESILLRYNIEALKQKKAPFSERG